MLLCASTTTPTVAIRDKPHGLVRSEGPLIGGQFKISVSQLVFLTVLCEGTEPLFRGYKALLESQLSKHIRKFFAIQSLLWYHNTSSSLTIKLFWLIKMPSATSEQRINQQEEKPSCLPRLWVVISSSSRGAHIAGERHISFHVWQAPSCCSSADFPMFSRLSPTILLPNISNSVLTILHPCEK